MDWVMNETELECHGFYDAVTQPLEGHSRDLDYGKTGELGVPPSCPIHNEEPNLRGRLHPDRPHLPSIEPGSTS